MWVASLAQEDPLEKEMATHSIILAWKIPWTEEFGHGLAMSLTQLSMHGCTLEIHFSFLFTMCTLIPVSMPGRNQLLKHILNVLMYSRIFTEKQSQIDIFLQGCLGNQKQPRDFSCLGSSRIGYFPYQCFRMKAYQGRKTIIAIIYHIDDNSKRTRKTRAHSAHSGDRRRLTQRECAGLTVY